MFINVFLPTGYFLVLYNCYLTLFYRMSKATKCTAILPAAARNMFRQGKYYQGPTFGVCPGYLQANMAMMDTSVADDFAEFCKQNYSACPLIYRSNAGEVTALLLAENSDIRYTVTFTYCGNYNIV